MQTSHISQLEFGFTTKICGVLPCEPCAHGVYIVSGDGVVSVIWYMRLFVRPCRKLNHNSPGLLHLYRLTEMTTLTTFILVKMNENGSGSVHSKSERRRKNLNGRGPGNATGGAEGLAS
jgi:hypothetical protein